MRRGSRQGTGFDDGTGELIDEGSYITPTRVGTYRTVDSVSSFGDGEESGITFADNPAYGRDEAGSRGAGNRGLSTTDRVEAYDYHDPDGSIGHVDLVDSGEHATSGREDGTFRTVANALRSRDRDYRSGDGRSGTHHGTDRGSRVTQGTDPVTGARTATLTETWDTTLDTLSSNGLGNQGNRADGSEDRFQDAGNSGQDLGHGSTLVTVTTATRVQDTSLGNGSHYARDYRREERRSTAGDSDDTTGTYDVDASADEQTAHTGRERGSLLYHRIQETQSIRQQLGGGASRRSDAAHWFIDDRRTDDPSRGDARDSNLASAANEHRQSTHTQGDDRGDTYEWTWGNSHLEEPHSNYWRIVDSTNSFEQRTPITLDFTQDLSQVNALSGSSRSGSQNVNSDRQHAWVRSQESTEHLDRDPLPLDPTDEHLTFVWNFSRLGREKSAADESGTWTNAGLTLDPASGDEASHADIQQTGESWDYKNWTRTTIYGSPYVGDQWNSQSQWVRTSESFDDHDQPIYDSTGVTGGTSHHERHTDDAHAGDGLVRTIRSHKVDGPPEGHQCYFALDPFDLIDISYNWQTYDYVEDATFTPTGKQGTYESHQHHGRNTINDDVFRASERVWDGPAGLLDICLDEITSISWPRIRESSGYTEVGQYPVFTDNSGVAKLYWHRHWEDGRDEYGFPPLVIREDAVASDATVGRQPLLATPPEGAWEGFVAGFKAGGLAVLENVPVVNHFLGDSVDQAFADAGLAGTWTETGSRISANIATNAAFFALGAGPTTNAAKALNAVNNLDDATTISLAIAVPLANGENPVNTKSAVALGSALLGFAYGKKLSRAARSADSPISGPAEFGPTYYRSYFLNYGASLRANQVVHHRVPQQYRELVEQHGGSVDRLGNLVGVGKADHPDITAAWRSFDAAHRGAPGINQILDFENRINKRFGRHFTYPRLE